jgi:polysaccharide deacetylase 2 family uncharacterized protein YibQ
MVLILTWGAGAVCTRAAASAPEGETGARDTPLRQESPASPLSKAAIVIDDFGNNMQGTQEMLDLPIPITVAVMPGLPSTVPDAEMAHAKGKEVIIHLPMEPVKGKKSWLGPGSITTDLTDKEIRARVEAAVDEIPYAIGMNNHMGSKATADPRVMRIVLKVCKERNLFFLDSRTTGKSVIGELCAELGVKTANNGLFFDEVYTLEHIMKQVERFKKHMGKHEQGIAIGHVGPPGKKTAFALKKAASEMSGKVEFVPVRELVK